MLKDLSNEELIDAMINNSVIGGREEDMMGDLYSEKNEIYKQELLFRLNPPCEDPYENCTCEICRPL